MPTFFHACATTIINLDRVESVHYDGATLAVFFGGDFVSGKARYYTGDDAAKVWNRLQSISQNSKPYPRGHDEYPRPWADVRPIPDGDATLATVAKNWPC